MALLLQFKRGAQSGEAGAQDDHALGGSAAIEAFDLRSQRRSRDPGEELPPCVHGVFRCYRQEMRGTSAEK